MIRRPPRSTRTDTLFPYTTLFRSNKLCLAGVSALALLTSTPVLAQDLAPADEGEAIVVTGQRAQQERDDDRRSEEHTSELQSLMRISYAVFCLKKKKAEYTHTIQSSKRH